MSRNNLYAHGFIRAAACAPVMRPAEPAANAREIIALAREADARAVALVVFPELCVSAYAIDDLLLQSALLNGVETALGRIIDASRNLLPVIVVGAPVRADTAIYNCAVVIHRGRIIGVTPKTYLPNYREFYEKRYFAAGDEATETELTIAGRRAPFGTDLLYAAEDLPDFLFHIEICEDLWAPLSPSTYGALAGATVLCNLSASNITIGKARERQLLCDAQSRRCAAAYLYATAGYGESTTDLAWDGQLAIFENGELLAEGERFGLRSRMTVADIDVGRLKLERFRTPTFRDAARRARGHARPFRHLKFRLGPPLEKDIPLERAIARFPFVPNDPARLDEDCAEATAIQARGLATRLAATGVNRAVIGVSGGLDSTLALLVAVEAFDLMGRPRSDIIGVTMPGFATGEATKANALALMASLGVDARTLDIRPAARQMLGDLGHPFAKGEEVYDVTFENVQAGLRTDYLFRLANKEGGLVVGTGDLSELALGWCTYGVGDQMSHYNVNASVAKTLIQHLIRWRASRPDCSDETCAVLRRILDTAITPELVPAGVKGVQRTEDTVGPYPLADFALYYLTRYGLSPSKILFLASAAWSDAARGDWPAGIGPGDRRAYSETEIRRWLRVFLERFFVSQFKRSAAPNGPKITSGGSLSPRGDWRAPSDASAATWLAELDEG